MARSKLKKLGHKPLMFNELPNFFTAIKKQSARAAAILAATGVEDALEFAISSRLKLNNDDYNGLFRGEGPLSSFAAKIKIGHALQLYGSETRADLDCIRDIRNVFAHTKEIVDFRAPLVAQACSDLKALDRGKKRDRRIKPRSRFVRTAKKIQLDLLNVATDPDAASDLP
jgi:hypothetical protein